MSRAQRRRKVKEEKQRATDKAIKEARANNVTSVKTVERLQIVTKLKQMGLMLNEMKSDGNCLYSAFLDQCGVDDAIAEVRAKVAGYLREHKADIQVFLVNTNTGDMYTDAEYEAYCDEVTRDGIWGGEIELRALAHLYGVQISVVQGNCEAVVYDGAGEGAAEKRKLVLCYHRHQLSLGEHYNSVKKIPAKNTAGGAF